LTSLPSLLGRLTTALQAHPLCVGVTVVGTQVFSPEQFFLKVRAELTGKSQLQVRVCYNHGHVDYAYQLFTDAPLLRWDNKEEFCQLATFPHHHHDEQGNVHPSPLIGDPIKDVEVVLQQVAVFVSQGSCQSQPCLT